MRCVCVCVWCVVCVCVWCVCAWCVVAVVVVLGIDRRRREDDE